MGLIEDARELANSSIETLTVSGTMVCAVCFHAGHKKTGCPVQSLPRIVAALEAAEALRASALEYAYNGGDVFRIELLARCETLRNP